MPLTPNASPKTERRSEEDNQQPNQQENQQGNQQPRSSILTLFGFTPNALIFPCPDGGRDHFHVMDIEADDTLVLGIMHGSPDLMMLLAVEFMMQNMMNLNVHDELAAETDAKGKEESKASSSESENEEKVESEFSSSESENGEMEVEDEEKEESSRFTI
ncbi:TPA: type IV secretion protein Dot [Legionella pneumophila]|nr:hypothetical protein [Legionella pneumophila]HAT8867662.1 type IV secretion protein Dot [Legionella pneumophila subsp. pneumophila]HAT7072820.1 type IV secretion protein Dot [Legionella pneumophila]HAT8641351.1 type IV secretion protein Dot [Legionella pneumophila]HAT8888895.1 type IV secretion protein Dot [Legionella pneumophila subsp. pneumophila]HAT8932519.1 type IV secretion protein Dot [Legionella pneumophila subsp. pneumophila]